MSNTNKYVADLIKVCSVLPVFAVMPAMATPILQTVGAGETYSIKASDNAKLSDNNITGKFDGGLIYVNGGGKLNIDGATFANNEFNSDNDSEWGFGNIFNKGEMDIVNAVFMNNFSTSGGAISNSMHASDGKIAGTKFKNNHAWADGGAISSFGPLSITGSVFEGNTAGFLKDESGKYTDVVTGIKNPVGGGAIALGAESETIVASIDSTEFKGNKSGLNGGAIGTRLALEVDEEGNWLDDKERHRNSAKLNVSATFEDNSAERNGGAIYNTFYTDANSSQGKGVIVKGEFENNHAGYHGGAIYNDGDKDTTGNGAIMTVINGEFEGNKAGDSGGAIYNSGELYVNGGTFEDNIAGDSGGAIYNSGQTDAKDLNMVNVNTIDRRDTAGVLEIKNATFLDNTATVYGGAIYNASAMILDDVTFVGNHADQVGGAMLLHNGSDTTISNALFDTNTAGWGGALYTTTGMKNLTITNTIFRNNSAKGTGGAGIYKHATLTDVTFDNNKATDKNGMGGGAMSLGSEAHLVLNTKASESNVFTGNKSETFGGAISTRDFVNGNNADAYLDIVNTKFAGNTAGKEGGAIDNYFYHSAKNADAVYLANSVFSGNSAANGGAVYNHGAESAPENKGGQSAQRASIDFDGVTFTGNTASVAGGAIYNETEANVFLSGNNTFTGNTANGVANDIYNDGMLTIASGMTSIDGGINGAGALDIQSDATLNMNYASIEQDSIIIDGTLMASLLNANDKVDISGALSGTGSVLLSVGATGVYDLGELKQFVTEDSFGSTYNVSLDDNKIATLTVKQAAEIAKETGITGGAAGAVSAFAASSDAKLQKVSLAVQEALNSGDVALVEKEMAKVNPDSKPVGHSVASSVQGQVVAVAAGRMSAVGGGAMGRSGGDVTSAGFWAQGLVNKSKMGSAFQGSTTGFALGGDMLVDNVLTLGGGFAFNSTEIEADGRDTDVESNSVFAYAQYKPSKWFVNGTVSYTLSDYTDDARVFGADVINNQYDTKAFGAQAIFGYDFASGVTPEAGLRYLYVSQEEHVDGLNRVIKEMNSDVLTGIAGLKYAFAIETDTAVKFSPSLRAAMTYDFVTPDAVATIVVPGTAPYYVDIDSLSRMGGEFGIGLTAEYRGLELSLNYELDLHKDYTSQTGLFKFRYNF